MSEISDNSLEKIAKGTSVVFIGIIIATVLNFVGRILIARYFTPSEYGIFSLGFVILNICVIISALGLSDGTTRQIAYYRGKKDFSKIKAIIFSSIQINVIASIILSIILFILSDFLSKNIFYNLNLSLPLKIFALAIPFLTLINIFVSIFRGFNRIKEKVYFQDALVSILYIFFLVPIIILGFTFISVIYSFTISIVLTCFVFIFYLNRRLPLLSGIGEVEIVFHPVKKELLLFSLPLLVVSMLQVVITYTDTLMIGVLRSSLEVGLYNVAIPLTGLITIPMSAMLLIYTPVTSGLYAKNLISDIRKNYTVLTKWVFSLTLPLFLIFFLYSDIVINFFFGTDYVSAQWALRILLLGAIIVNLLGPNGVTLVAIGKTKFLMWASLVAAIMNIGLNIFLIPIFGIAGAAYASTISVATHCIIRNIKVYFSLDVSPLSKNLLKPSLIFIGIVAFFYLIIEDNYSVSFWMLLVLILIFYGMYFLIMIFTKSIDQEDINMISIIEKRLGLKTSSRLIKILKKFM